VGSRLRKLLLTIHVVSSVGWLGAVAAFLALAIAGLVSANAQSVRAAYLAMDLVGWYVIVPSSLASVASGVIQGLGTPWGLFRHYWVLIKLVMAILATAVLLIHMQPIGRVAAAAADGPLPSEHLHGMRVQILIDAAAALIVLVVATVLSIYKPKGLTRYGRRVTRAVTDNGTV